MSRKEPTPGPWVWSGEYALYGANHVCVMAARDGMIYSEHSSDPACIEVPNEADRPLLAAAPIMLAALKRARLALKDCNMADDLSAVEDAIAKAEM
jgi:hypothetical protein